MNIIFIAALWILIILWLEERNYSSVQKEVKERWSAGDHTCGAVRKWYGWRVKEYAEEAE